MANILAAFEITSIKDKDERDLLPIPEFSDAITRFVNHTLYQRRPRVFKECFLVDRNRSSAMFDLDRLK